MYLNIIKFVIELFIGIRRIWVFTKNKSNTDINTTIPRELSTSISITSKANEHPINIFISPLNFPSYSLSFHPNYLQDILILSISYINIKIRNKKERLRTPNRTHRS